jgi:hypothetical protein
MNALVSRCAAALLALSWAHASASETILLDPNQPAPRAAERRLAKVESLNGQTACEVALAPNGVVQNTHACTAWPLVVKSKKWVREGGRLSFLDPEGRVTVTFYMAGEDVFVTGRAEPEFLRLTILPPPAQLRLQPSIPLKQ